MDHDSNEPQWAPQTLYYRCACGSELPLRGSETADCPQCGRAVAADALKDALAATVAFTPTEPLREDGDAPGPDRCTGRLLGHFEILEPIGGGGVGQVYRALDTSLQRYVAVKVLRRSRDTDAAVDSAGVDRLLQEAVAQARVNHPNVVTIYYVGKHDGEPFLAMELVGGETVAQRLRSGPLPFSRVAPLALQVARALARSHELGIIHGDIKPSNLLTTDRGQVKLSDFGMARSLTEPGADSPITGGTPNYLAPELLEGQRPTIQSDMYALGVTLFEITFGRLPVKLSGSSLRHWLRELQEATVAYPESWPEDVPSRWQAILERLLARDPHDRYPSYERLIDDLQSVLPIPAVPARPVPRAVALAIDLVALLLLYAAIPVLMMFGAAGLYLLQVDLGAILPRVVVSLLVPLPVLLVGLVESATGQSLGRQLMHLRVVNRFGFAPSRRVLLARSVGRLLPVWVGAIAWAANGLGVPVWLTAPLVALSLVALFVDCASALVIGRGRSLHDRWLRTRVVLDTQA